MPDVEFYNMKFKRKVSVPHERLQKQVLAKPGSVQRRYALVAEADGTKMFKFISEATFESLDVPEVSL